ncbi:hypothetical protein ACH42_08480 [Endozoicomonas sp. (ex Bugula neritina AB1)]|nr:hypothetical protein ACH42_08480 [Endozoicomonas sp. (ex Bugula neritina AB1)]
MRNEIVPVKNIAALARAGQALIDRPGQLDHGLGMITGESGVGKTKASYWFALEHRAFYVRAMSAWRSPTPLLESLGDVLGVQNKRSSYRMLKAVADEMSRQNRPVFVDEADYLLRFDVLRDTIRDLHEATRVPVILVGHTGIERKVKESPQFENRFLIDVRFEPLSLDDARLLAARLCEVQVADDLLEDLHKYARGNTRKINTGLYRIEQCAATLQVERMSLTQFRQVKGTYFLGAAA